LNHFKSHHRHFTKSPSGWREWIRRFNESRRRLSQGRKRLYASSLAFKTILAIVPALAIIMAVLAADGFTHQRERLLDQIVDVIYPVDSTTLSLDPDEQKNIEELNQIGKQQIRLSVQRFAGHAAKVGLWGLVAFFAILLFLMRDVEHSFNILWGIDQKRPWLTQALRHGIFLIGAPLMAIAFLSLEEWVRSVHLFHPALHSWIFSVALPYVLLGLLCAWMFIWIPNVKVEHRSALLAGFVTAFLIETGRRCITWYAVHIVSQSRIYGALWIFPVILLWFYLSWIIILLGAEVTYIFQEPSVKKV
jgi:membrane protein